MQYSRTLHRLVARCAGLIAILCLILVAACAGGADTDSSADAWEVEGPLLAWDGDIWVVDGEAIVVSGPLNRDDQRQLGAIVAARGTYDEDGLRIADTIEINGAGDAETTLPAAELAGAIEAIDGNTLMIDGTAVLLPVATRLTAEDGSDDVALWTVGSHAEVRGYRLSDDRVIALEVILSPAAADEGDPDTSDDVPEQQPMIWFPGAPGGERDDATHHDDQRDEQDAKDKKEKVEKDKQDTKHDADSDAEDDDDQDSEQGDGGADDDDD